jgi:excisionase family DNA binding protein
MSEDIQVEVSTVCRMLNISPQTVYRMIHTGRLPAFRAGVKSFRISMRDLRKLMAEKIHREANK